MTPRREIQVNPAFLASGGKKGGSRSGARRVAKKSGTGDMRKHLLRRIDTHRRNARGANGGPGTAAEAGKSELQQSLDYLEKLAGGNNRKTRKKRNGADSLHTTRSAPSFGCLKNGTLPTFREWSKSAPVSDREAALSRIRLTRQHAPGPASGPKPTLQPKPTESSATASVTPAPSVPAVAPVVEQKASRDARPRAARTRRVRLGKTAATRKVSVLLTDGKLRQLIEADRATARQASIHAVCKHLRCKGLLKHGSKAPDQVLRAMYETTLLCEVKNKGQGCRLHNYKAEAGESA